MTDGVAQLGLVLDCADPERLAEFWAPALGYVNVGTAGSYVALFPNGATRPETAPAAGRRTEGRQEPDALRHRGRRHPR